MSNSPAPRRLYTPRTSRRFIAAVGPRDRRAVHRVDRTVLRHRPLPAAADDVRDHLDRAEPVAVAHWRWDPYPFILLNLAFSTQAAYAAPLILLAQNRQENRDRVTLDEDRRRASQTKADTEYLARELAALRLSVGEVATRDYLRHELEESAHAAGGSAVVSTGKRDSDRPTAPSGVLRNRAENPVRHCATPVTRVMYGDLVHEGNK